MIELLAGDVDNNWVVNFTDLTIVNNNYNLPVNQASDPNADIDGNGTINFTDLTIVNNNYNKKAVVEP